MSRLTSVRPEFVESIPKDLEDGVLYVSIAYSTTAHNCPCGCGSRVVLPISPPKWRVLYDGETVSMWPSVGNWSYQCQSHYWIEQNTIEWAAKLSPAKIEAIREGDKAARSRYLSSSHEPEVAVPDVSTSRRRGLIDRLRGILRR